MKTQVKAEEFMMFIFSLWMFQQLDYSWGIYFAFILVPDIGMIGYLINAKIGAISYNLFHNKGIAIIFYLAGVYFQQPAFQLTGVILFSHSCLDRVLGYGLKYPDSFYHTHLGFIGKIKNH